jgi:hypothetical protein
VAGTDLSEGALDDAFDIRGGEDDLVLSHGGGKHVTELFFWNESITVIVIDAERHWRGEGGTSEKREWREAETVIERGRAGRVRRERYREGMRRRREMEGGEWWSIHLIFSSGEALVERVDRQEINSTKLMPWSWFVSKTLKILSSNTESRNNIAAWNSLEESQQEEVKGGSGEGEERGVSRSINNSIIFFSGTNFFKMKP